MAEKISAKVQNILKWLVPLLLIFAIFFALNEKKQEQIVVLPEDHTETEIVDELKERGYLSNSISYFIAKIALKLGIDIESGGFSLSKDMGPVFPINPAIIFLSQVLTRS